MASLQIVLKNAIQVKDQLADNELAAEPLPDDANRRFLLFYEASEGGADVLRRLIDEPDALAEVAQVALNLCHYDLERLLISYWNWHTQKFIWVQMNSHGHKNCSNSPSNQRLI